MIIHLTRNNPQPPGRLCRTPGPNTPDVFSVHVLYTDRLADQDAVCPGCRQVAALLAELERTLPWIGKVGADAPEGDPTGIAARANRAHDHVRAAIEWYG